MNPYTKYKYEHKVNLYLISCIPVPRVCTNEGDMKLKF